MTNGIECPIWGTPATARPTDGDYSDIDSPRAGGRYQICGTAIATVRHLGDQQRACLTTWLVRQRLLGTETPRVTDGVVQASRSWRRSAVVDRANMVLRHIARREREPGKRFQHPTLAGQDDFFRYLAWSESTLGGEGDRGSIRQQLRFFVTYLIEQEWIKEFGSPPKQEYELTVKGYSHASDLESPGPDSSQGFVAMWFDGQMDAAWEDGIRPAIEEAGYDPVRIDREEHLGRIDDAVIAAIRRSRFVVADFTHDDRGARGSVYYEAGFAHGLQIPVIFTCRKDLVEELHFDTRQYNHIIWETPEELGARLAQRIAAVLGDGPKSRRLAP